jgi:hypothetical protein
MTRRLVVIEQSNHGGRLLSEHDRSDHRRVRSPLRSVGLQDPARLA